MSEHVYRIKYSITPGEFSKAELEADKCSGGCDQVLVCSYVENPDGSGRYLWLSSDGAVPHAEMDSMRQFRCMTLLAHKLSEDESLGPGHRLACETFFELVRAAILSSREKEGV